MHNHLTSEEIDKLARKRTGAKMGWYLHLAIYLTVNAGLFLASSLMFGTRNYHLGPLLGWGIVWCSTASRCFSSARAA